MFVGRTFRSALASVKTYAAMQIASAMLIGTVVAEFVAGSGGAEGLAWRIREAGNRLQTARMFAALAVLGALGAVLPAVLEAMEKAGLRWWRGR